MGDLKHAGVKGMKWGVRKEEAARNVDDADAGIVSKTPVIVFNGLNTLKVNSSNRLSDLKIEDAQLRLLEEDI